MVKWRKEVLGFTAMNLSSRGQRLRPSRIINRSMILGVICFHMQIIYHPKAQIFMSGLEPRAYSKILRAVDMLGEYGYRLMMPYAKRIEPGLWELRIHDQQEVRLFYAIRGARAFILHGFIKKSMLIPRRELDVARRRLSLLDKL